MGLQRDSLDIETSQPRPIDIQNSEIEEQSTDKETSATAQDNKNDVEKNGETSPTEQEPPQYATAKELSILSTVFTIATFMIAIDGSILGKTSQALPRMQTDQDPATAIPSITSDFSQIEDAPWYGSAYLLTEMSFQPTFGRLYSLFDPKILYLISIAICKLFTTKKRRRAQDLVD